VRGFVCFHTRGGGGGGGGARAPRWWGGGGGGGGAVWRGPGPALLPMLCVLYPQLTD
jgi:hypothetical protein